MPKYTFKCSLGHTTQKITSSSVFVFPCDEKFCSSVMERQMPTLNGPANVREVVDKHTGITHTDGQKDMIQDRKEEYYWSIEVPRMVNSGTYSLETMLENSWIWVDDAGKIHINNKPPSKR